jgi:hypothetical protein
MQEGIAELRFNAEMAKMAKRDIKSAFLFLPICPDFFFV